jgi:hypothetical protein
VILSPCSPTYGLKYIYRSTISHSYNKYSLFVSLLLLTLSLFRTHTHFLHIHAYIQQTLYFSSSPIYSRTNSIAKFYSPFISHSSKTHTYTHTHTRTHIHSHSHTHENDYGFKEREKKIAKRQIGYRRWQNSVAYQANKKSMKLIIIGNIVTTDGPKKAVQRDAEIRSFRREML